MQQSLWGKICCVLLPHGLKLCVCVCARVFGGGGRRNDAFLIIFHCQNESSAQDGMDQSSSGKQLGPFSKNYTEYIALGFSFGTDKNLLKYFFLVLPQGHIKRTFQLFLLTIIGSAETRRGGGSGEGRAGVASKGRIFSRQGQNCLRRFQPQLSLSHFLLRRW